MSIWGAKYRLFLKMMVVWYPKVCWSSNWKNTNAGLTGRVQCADIYSISTISKSRLSAHHWEDNTRMSVPCATHLTHLIPIHVQAQQRKFEVFLALVGTNYDDLYSQKGLGCICHPLQPQANKDCPNFFRLGVTCSSGVCPLLKRHSRHFAFRNIEIVKCWYQGRTILLLEGAGPSRATSSTRVHWTEYPKA